MKTNTQIVFPFSISTVKYPDMRRFLGMMKNIKTAVCGRKTKCNDGNEECHMYCIKSDTMNTVKELNKFPEDGDIIM